LIADKDNGYKEQKCPYCGKQLNGDEYKHAMEEFKAKAAQYKIQYEKQRKYYEEQIDKQKSILQEEISKLNNSHNKELKTITKELQNSFQSQLESIKKTYEEIGTQKQGEFNESLDRQSCKYEEELYEKDKEFQELKESLEKYKSQAIDDARSVVQKEIYERDTQIQRLGAKVASLTKDLTKTQSELSGEVGELDLLKKLQDAFPEDTFRRQSRGNSSADIIQYIKTTAGEQDVIVYDNKESSSVNKQDLEKAKRYREIHGTDNVIIVSRNVSKETNERLGKEQEKILILHPDVVVLVAKIIRKELIEISKQALSKKDLQTKRALLYDYIRSKEFSRNIESISECVNKLLKGQETEISAHKRWWKSEQALYGRIGEFRTNITSSIDAIVQQQYQEEQDTLKSETAQELKSKIIADHGNGNGNRHTST
jgi:hypothetical protein